jgi:hypothetical protein
LKIQKCLQKGQRLNDSRLYYQPSLRNIIDVAALDTHLLEQSEYNDRVKLYAQRLAHQWSNIQVNDVKYNGE